MLLVTKIWEQRKLGEIGKLQSGIGFPSTEQGGTEGIPFYKVSDMNNPDNEHEMTNANNYVTNEQLTRRKWNPIKNVPAVIFAKVGAAIMLNRKRLVTIPFLIDNNTMTYSFSNCLEINFGKTLFETIYLPKYVQIGALPSYNISDIQSIKVFIPNKDEQIKIGKFINIFNNLITLYERKTRLLSKLRTFLTQRLFSNSSKVSLYFDNKNWSKHKISEFLTERNEKVIPNPSIPLVSFTVEKGVTPKSKRYNREFLVKDDKKKYKITKKNDIVYNPANLKFGAIARNKFGNAAFSPIYVTFITKLNPVFTEFLVRRKDFIKLALKYQEGTVYERMAVKSKDFLSLKIYLPNSSRDINHIAQILQSLDTLVSLNKNKISLITLIKKELLNTMFI